MAAFQFPDPAVTQTVKNPITGSTYQWQDPPGKWVVTVSIREVGDIIWEGDNPPNPIGDYKLWYSTDTLELYFYYTDSSGTSAWLPTSKPITMLNDLDAQVFDINTLLQQVNIAASTNENEIQLIKDGLGQVDLEEVLTNGNIADKKNLFLTHSENETFIDLSVTERRIVMLATGAEAVPKYELRHWNGMDSAKAAIEIDEDGSRLDFEAEGKIDNMHFRFQNDDKLILNKSGDAEFTGKVKVQPGTSNNEVVTYGQLVSLEEELEQLAPSIERGSWTWTTNANPGPGQYTTIQEADDAGLAACAATWQECLIIAGTDNIAKAQCQRDYDSCLVQYKPGPNPDFSKTYQIKFNAKDSQGNDHTFGTVEVGQLIDVFNDSNDDYLTGEITIKSGTTITITRVSSKGFASGLGRIKIFSINDEVSDLTNYVRKSGDTMSGELRIQPPAGAGTGESLIVKAGADLAGTVRDIFVVRRTDGDYSLYVDEAGNIGAGNDWDPTGPRHLTHKKYVDDQIATVSLHPRPAQLRWAWSGVKSSGTTTKPNDGSFYIAGTSGNRYLRLSFISANGIDIGYSPIADTQAVSTQYGPLGTIWYSPLNRPDSWRMMRQFRIESYRWNAFGHHIEFEISSSKGTDWDKLVIPTSYYVTIGGFF